MSAEPTTEEGSSLIGRVVGGKIRIDAHLGSGAMGHVYRAHHLTLHKDVAVKVMRKLDGQADVHARRFAREARTASQIDHPNSVAILDFGEDGPDRLLYLAMEFVEGEELQSILTRDGGLTAERTCEVMIQALGAIAHAHDKGVIHRDLKPSNLILTQRTNDEGQRVDFVKVCDFGLAKFVSGVRDSLDGSAASAAKVVGTPAYMSPEQAVGDALDVRSDLYSVGVILYEMFTGRLPFDAETPMGVMLKHVAEEPVPPSHHAPYLPTDVDRVVMWALRKPRSQRCQTARELRNAVRQLLLQMSGELSAVALPRPVEPSYAMTSEEEPLPLPASALMPAADELSLTDDLVAQPQQFADLSMDLELPPATPAIPETESLDVAPAELDMEALVNEAVQSVAEEAHSGSTQPQQDSFLLAGLDPRNVSAEVSDRAMYMWNHYGITFEPYEGEHAFWVRDHRGKEMGPLALEDMIRIVSTEGAAGHAHDVSVAVEAGQWLPATTFARLTGQEALLDHAVYMPASSSGDVLSGDLERTSLAALFTRIAKDGPTGRLRFELLVQQSQIRFELHLAAGRPTFVYANEPSLQLPRLLVQQGLVQEHLLPRFLAMVIADERPMEAVVGQVASMDLSAYRAVFMRERLAFLFKNARGRFSLDTQALPARTEPFAPTLLALLPELVYRAMPLGALQAEVAPYMTKPLSRSERFKSDARHLRLSQSQVDVVRALLRSPNLAEAMPSDGRQRLYMAMAYVLVETGLLLPPL